MTTYSNTAFRAASLAERLALPPPSIPSDAALASASDTLEWWQQTFLPGRPTLLRRALAAAGLSRGATLTLIAAGQEDSVIDPAVDAPGHAPRWRQVQDQIFAGADPAPVPEGRLHFESAVEGFVRWAADRLGSALTTAPAVDRPALAGAFRTALTAQLLAMAGQTFILRLHTARLTGRLRGDTPEARFQDFVRTELSTPAALSRLLAAYPVLARALVTTTEQMLGAWVDLLGHLTADRVEIADTFGIAVDDTLSRIDPGLGDTHRGGRTVMLLGFASGARLVYKPRPMAVDAHLQGVLAWLNDRGIDATLRTVGVLDRGEHGWMEFVHATSCTTAGQVDAYYRRMGALLFVLHLLDATDVHRENLIAAGEHPILVDLESLFQTRPDAPRRLRDHVHARTEVFHTTVLRTGLLPLRVEGSAGVADFGGITGGNDQATPYPIPEWQRPNTDEMALVYRTSTISDAPNMPVVAGVAASVFGHEAALVDGFTAAYRLVVAHREAFAAPRGPLAAFGRDLVRHVLRHTVDYAHLIAAGQHPSYLRDGADRDALFSALWLAAEREPHLARLVPAEQRELWRGDVPSFRARVDSRDLEAGDGTVYRRFFARSGLVRVHDRLARLGENDLLRQCQAIKGSIASVRPAGVSAPVLVGDDAALSPAAGPLAAATAIGEHIVRMAIRDGDAAYWTGLLPLPHEGFAYVPLATDLYEGNAGIALFLAYLAHATARADLRALARAAFQGVRRHLDARVWSGNIGAWTGEPGLLYAAMHLAVLWDDPSLLPDLPRAMRRLGRQVKHDRGFDLTSGASGAILVFLRLHAYDATAGALDVARVCGDHLLRNAIKTEHGLAWPGASPTPLLGLAHGTAGHAWALAELAAATDTPRYAEAARAVLAHERAYFNASTGNWPDLRREPGASGPAHMWGWCHGAPGIAIARLRMRAALPDRQIDAEIDAALASTRSEGFGAGGCLCHGDLGNIEPFLLMAEVTGAAEWRTIAEHQVEHFLESVRRTGDWRCGSLPGIDSPGLMTGLAGAGYALLRIAAPERVPSLLALDAPCPGPIPTRKSSHEPDRHFVACSRRSRCRPRTQSKSPSTSG